MRIKPHRVGQASENANFARAMRAWQVQRLVECYCPKKEQSGGYRSPGPLFRCSAAVVAGENLVGCETNVPHMFDPAYNDRMAANPSTGKPFPDKPAPIVVERFFAYLNATGRPHTWEHHDHSRPPPDQDFEELRTFEVPEKFRAEVGMAPCPVCCPDAPKYLSGVLCWFPEEGVLRCIGRECAAGHFGNERAARARNTRKRQEALEIAERALEEGLPLLEGRRCKVASKLDRAAELDRVRELFDAHATKAGRRALVRLASSSGGLPINEVETAKGVDRFGDDRDERIERTVEIVRLDGLAFLRRDKSLGNLASGTERALGLLPEECSEDSILDYIIERSEGDGGELLNARTLLLNAETAFDELMTELDAAERFLAPANLIRLARWWDDHRTSPPFQFRYDQRRPYEIMVGSNQRGAKSLRAIPTRGTNWKRRAA